MMVSVPIADVRASPVSCEYVALPARQRDNPFQRTQVLMGECVEILSEDGEWLYVQLPEQPVWEYDKGRWAPCIGWLRKEQVVAFGAVRNLIATAFWTPIFCLEKNDTIFAVSVGTALCGIKQAGDFWIVILPSGEYGKVNKHDITYLEGRVCEPVDYYRKLVVDNAVLFCGVPYAQGCRSAWIAACDGDYDAVASQISCVDCSGLTSLAMRSCGLIIPRYAHAQFLASKKIEHGSALQPGDFVFLADLRRNPLRISHVMIYADNDTLIESQGVEEPYGVRCIASVNAQRLRCSLAALSNGQRIGDRWVVYFGTFFADGMQVQSLRDKFLEV